MTDTKKDHYCWSDPCPDCERARQGSERLLAAFAPTPKSVQPSTSLGVAPAISEGVPSDPPTPHAWLLMTVTDELWDVSLSEETAKRMLRFRNAPAGSNSVIQHLQPFRLVPLYTAEQFAATPLQGESSPPSDWREILADCSIFLPSRQAFRNDRYAKDLEALWERLDAALAAAIPKERRDDEAASESIRVGPPQVDPDEFATFLTSQPVAAEERRETRDEEPGDFRPRLAEYLRTRAKTKRISEDRLRGAVTWSASATAHADECSKEATQLDEWAEQLDARATPLKEPR